MKIIVLIVFMVSSTAAFGQFRFDMFGHVEPDLLQITVPNGDAGNPNNTNGVPFIGPPRIDIFNGGMFNNNVTHASGGFMEVNNLFMRLQYTGSNYDAHMRIWGNQFVSWNMGLFADRYEGADGPTVRTNFSIVGFLNAFIEEWRVRARMGPFTVYMGNEEGNFGRVTALNNHTPALYSKVNIFGVTTPARISNPYFYYLNPHQAAGEGDGGGLNFAEINTRSPHATLNWEPDRLNALEPNNPYLLITYTHNQFDFTLGTHLQGPIDDAVNPYGALVKFGNIDVNGYFRVSGNRIADMVTFDLVYRIKGAKEDFGDMDPDGIYNAPNVVNPTRSRNGSGNFGHSIGLFAQPNLDSYVIGLNVILGYSAIFQTLENVGENWDGNGNEAYKRKAPFFSGIDLRASYSNIPMFLFTTQNNISFAGMKGSDNDEVWGLRPRFSDVAGVSPLLRDGESDSWFYLYNTLGAQYTVNEQVVITLGFANRFGLLTEKRDYLGDIYTARRTTNWFSGELMTAYFYQRWSWELWGGIAFLHQYSTYTSNDERFNNVGSGRFVFAIPIRFVWRVRAGG